MDPSSAPWRAFETVEPGAPDDAPGTGSRSGAASPGAAAQPVPRVVLFGALAAIVLLAAGAVAMASGGTNPAIVVGSGGSSGTEPSSATTDLVIDVGGAVVKPGVYHLAPGSRISDAIAAAGGYGPRVDAERTSASLNLAAPLEDGQQIQVPSRDDSAGDGSGGPGGSPASGSQGTPGGGLVDLNHASQAELEALPGIGPVTAGKIIASRETTPFATVQELRDRKLVGQKTFDGLKDLVAVR